MSNLCKRMAKPKKLTGKKIRQRLHERCSERCSKQYTSFNIFDGENLVVHSDKPMTVVEAQYYYRALSISGID